MSWILNIVGFSEGTPIKRPKSSILHVRTPNKPPLRFSKPVVSRASWPWPRRTPCEACRATAPTPGPQIRSVECGWSGEVVVVVVIAAAAAVAIVGVGVGVGVLVR